MGGGTIVSRRRAELGLGGGEGRRGAESGGRRENGPGAAGCNPNGGAGGSSRVELRSRAVSHAVVWAGGAWGGASNVKRGTQEMHGLWLSEHG